MGYYTITEEDQHVTATRCHSRMCEQETAYSRPSSADGDGPGNDNILSMTCYTGVTAKTYFYLTDHLGSVHALADESGNIVESYNYDAWGRVLGVYDANGNTLEKSAVGNRYLWQGREYSFATGLYYFRARWYDPTVGRFLSNDPLGVNGGMNQYVFCGNNPVNFVDPSGLCKKKSLLSRLFSGITAPAWWLLNDLSAAMTGIQGTLWGAATLDINGIVPRYDYHGGPNWPYGNLDRNAPFTDLGQTFYLHDQRYRVNVPGGQMTTGEADWELMRNMWALGITEQPGPFGQVYRALASVAFGAKITLWDSWYGD